MSQIVAEVAKGNTKLAICCSLVAGTFQVLLMFPKLLMFAKLLMFTKLLMFAKLLLFAKLLMFAIYKCEMLRCFRLLLVFLAEDLLFNYGLFIFGLVEIVG